jgi:hypothetical protein
MSVARRAGGWRATQVGWLASLDVSDTLDVMMSGYSPARVHTSRTITDEVQQLVKSGVLWTRVMVERLVDDLDGGTEPFKFSWLRACSDSDTSSAC